MLSSIRTLRFRKTSRHFRPARWHCATVAATVADGRATGWPGTGRPTAAASAMAVSSSRRAASASPGPPRSVCAWASCAMPVIIRLRTLCSP